MQCDKCLSLFEVLLAIATFILQGSPIAKGQEESKFSVIFVFSTPDTGESPQSGVIRDAAGNLYGTTYGDFAPLFGAVFKLDPAGRETVLHRFTDEENDGANPSGGLIRDEAGNFYGNTQYGGTFDRGTVFKLDPAGSLTVLHSFAGGADGATPWGSLVRDATGNFYGITAFGGPSDNGTVFKLDPNGTKTVLHSFTGGPDGSFPLAGLVQDSGGNLYGTAAQGGVTTCPRGCGVVFKLDPTGALTVLHSFTGAPDGSYPQGVLTRDAEGNLYGTTFYGGLALGLGFGTVFKVDPAGKETLLYKFADHRDGSYPSTGLVRDTAGNLYGTASGDGAVNFGTVFKLDPAGTLTVLHSFDGGAWDGAFPSGRLVRDGKGNLYGTTSRGGAHRRCFQGCGTVFKVKP